jgi:Predicted choloylglycine hydrolase
MSGAFFGNLSGINDRGLAIAITGIFGEISFPDNGGISMPIIVRGVLDKATDVQSATDLLTHIPHTTPCTYALIDKTGSMAVVEVSANNIKVRKNSSVNYLTATNHFQALSNEMEKVRVLPNSIRRQKSIESFHDKNPSADIDSIFNFFGDTINGPAMNNYSSLLGTLWTIIYLPEKNKMIFRVGLDGEKNTFTINQKREGKFKGILKDRPPKASDYF